MENKMGLSDEAGVRLRALELAIDCYNGETVALAKSFVDWISSGAVPE